MSDDRGAQPTPRSLDGFAVDRSRNSPNHGPRLGFATPEIILLHYTGMKDGPSAVDRLCDPASQVSCHYVVAEDGRVLQLVEDDRRAWHAGRSVWAGIVDINSASIGIEIVNGGHDFGLPGYPDAQMGSVVALCRTLTERHRIRPERLLAHSDVAPTRKRDPGEHFSWRRLAAAGLGHWAEPASWDDGGAVLELGAAGAAVADLQKALAQYGYGIAVTGEFDAATVGVVSAFQRHFRPARFDGCADEATRSILSALLAHLPGSAGRRLKGGRLP